MAFKTKTKTRLLIDDRQTLDAKHNNILKSFTDIKDTINILYSELDSINLKLNDLNSQNSYLTILNIELQTQIWLYDDKKKAIELEINRIENNIDENEYMLKTGKLLSNYYKIINEEKNITLNNKINDKNSLNSDKINDKNSLNSLNSDTINDKNSINSDTINDNTINNDNTTKNINTSGIPNKKKRNITDWFQINDDAIDIETNIKTENTYDIKTETNSDIKNKNNSENNFKNNVNKYKNQKTQIFMHQNKDVIYDKYMKLIDKNYISTTNNNNKNFFDTCDMCNIEMLLNNNTGQITCPNCGYIENIIVDSDKPSFKEPPKEMTSFCYKRINHLNEFLAQFQAKETTDIPETVYNDIIMEIKKERIRNMAVITPDKMRTILKKIKKNDYYEHIPYIINQLNGLPAPVIAPEIEEIIRGMFKAIQIPFEKYCPFKRKNFLSYNYVMYKFFELLELDEYLTCFQLLKSRTKLHQQDQIWKNICKDLNWQYINSL
jgi:hypothetical protein